MATGQRCGRLRDGRQGGHGLWLRARRGAWVGCHFPGLCNVFVYAFVFCLFTTGADLVGVSLGPVHAPNTWTHSQAVEPPAS